MTDEGVDLEQQVAPLVEIADRLVCEQCGAVLNEEQTKCPRCGVLIEEEDEVEESLLHWGDEVVYPEDVCDV